MPSLINEEVSGLTKTVVLGCSYIANNGSQVVFSLPSTLTVGGRFEIVGRGIGGWKIVSDSGSAQTIAVGSTTVTSSGSNADDLVVPANAYATAEFVVVNTGTIVMVDSNVADDSSMLAAVSGGFQGTVSGYASGGDTGSRSNVVDKFSFSSDGNASDVGDLSVSRYGGAGQSSNNFGYVSGGNSGSVSNVIDKFDFSSDGNASDVGDLTFARQYPSGQQY